MNEKFKESYERFRKWRHETEEGKKVVGFCNWQLEHELFYLECWNHTEKGGMIFQIWPDGHGFGEFIQIERNKVTLAIANVDELFEEFPDMTIEVSDYIDRLEYVREVLQKML